MNISMVARLDYYRDIKVLFSYSLFIKQQRVDDDGSGVLKVKMVFVVGVCVYV
jgi:hypothetical protein